MILTAAKKKAITLTVKEDKKYIPNIIKKKYKKGQDFLL